MKGLAIIIALLTILVTMPISIYLQYSILSRIGATELMWFLFYVNVPVIILTSILAKILSSVSK